VRDWLNSSYSLILSQSDGCVSEIFDGASPGVVVRVAFLIRKRQ